MSTADRTPVGNGTAAAEPVRRRLTRRRVDTVHRLADAALRELRATGYADLTVRAVAARAGVAPATAYTYFASKNHLVTELLWRRLHATPALIDLTRPAGERVAQVLREIAQIMVDEPELAAACTAAMLGADPDVTQLRVRIGAEIRDRLRAALGPEPDPVVLTALEFAYAGALVHAAMGFASYEQIADGLAESAAVIMEGRS